MQDSISILTNCEFRQLRNSLLFIDITATKSDIEHMKAVQQTLMDNQQVILQSLHQNQTNIDRLGKLYFSYSQKVILLQLKYLTL